MHDSHLYSYLALFSVVVLYAVYRKFTRISISDINGPKSPGFWLGNTWDLAEGEVGILDSLWQDKYGCIVRFRGPLREDRLWISDPKALQHILQTSAYDYPKPVESRIVGSLATGNGLAMVEGVTHKRQRKVMLPAFGVEVKSFVPLFRDTAEKMVLKLNEIILQDTTGKSATIDMPFWFSRATLDAIGAAAFDYNFGALDDLDNKLTKSYTNLVLSFFGSPTPEGVFARDVTQYIPPKLLTLMYNVFPGSSFGLLRRNKEIVYQVAEELFRAKSEDVSIGRRKKDVMSVLVDANVHQSPEFKLEDREVLEQMRTIMITGHEPTSNTLSWTLLEIAKNPKVQDKLRAEIRQMEARIRTRGDQDLTIDDMENMPYLVAITKESLRCNPVSYYILREAGKDDILPLSKPIVSSSREILNEVPIPKGLKMVLSIAAYNRNKDLWGEDAEEFNPDRWLSMEERKGASIGIYANLMTFSTGVRSCIGYRIAVIEIQTFLITLISNYQFSVDRRTNIRRGKSGLMIPVVEGELGCQLPLRVSLLDQEA